MNINDNPSEINNPMTEPYALGRKGTNSLTSCGNIAVAIPINRRTMPIGNPFILAGLYHQLVPKEKATIELYLQGK